MGWKERLRQVYVTWRWIWPHLALLLKSILSQGGKNESNLIQFLLESVDMGWVIYLQYPIRAAVGTIWTLTLATLVLAKSRLKPFWKWYQSHSHPFPACDSGAWDQTWEQDRSLPELDARSTSGMGITEATSTNKISPSFQLSARPQHAGRGNNKNRTCTQMRS